MWSVLFDDEIPVSGTLDIATLSYNTYGLNIDILSTKFTQCQATFRLLYEIQLMLTFDVFTMKQVKI